jgi:hypothetical protein
MEKILADGVTQDELERVKARHSRRRSISAIR